MAWTAVDRAVSARRERRRPGDRAGHRRVPAVGTSGGDPGQLSGPPETVASTPRERRCPAVRHRRDLGQLVGSARAAVSRSGPTSQHCPQHRLRASGGVPRRDAIEVQATESAPRERRCPERRRVGQEHGQAGSARADVSRHPRRPDPRCRRRLRTSGGVPHGRPAMWVSEEPAPRERRCPVPGGHGPPLGHVRSARAEGSRHQREDGHRHPRRLHASGGAPPPTVRGAEGGSRLRASGGDPEYGAYQAATT